MLNFNVDPYYDDFDPNKNFHRILFRPGRAVQARELTQAQTILQDQISKFADHIFKQNTPVKGGQVTVDTRARYLKLNATYNDNDVVASDFLNTVIYDEDGVIFAKVIATEEATAGDPPTLIVSYFSGQEFSAGDVIISESGPTAQVVPSDHSGFATTASISEGVFYIVNGYSFSSELNDDGSTSRYSIGNFVSVSPQTIIVQKYGQTPTRRIGLSISEFVSDYVTDTSLLDPAVGASNFQAPGADRYTIKLTLDTKPIESGTDQSFIELVRITEGTIQRLDTNSIYSTIDDYFAKRTFDTNGDFIVNDFKITPRANTANADTYQLQVGTGVAYIKGYRVESTGETVLETTRARETETINNNLVSIDYGNYLLVNNANGAFDVTSVTPVDFHVINANSSIVTTNNTTYNSTKVGTGYLRALDFYTAGSDANTKTYVYKAHISDVQTATLSSNAAAATSTTIQFYDQTGKFSTAANAYYGVTLTIDSGPSAGDTRTIVSYNQSTKTATVNAPFTVTPTVASNFSLRFGVKDIDLVVQKSGSGISASAGIDLDGKVDGVSNKDTRLFNTGSPELLFNVGYPFVASLSDETYVSYKMSRSVSFASGVGTFNLGSADATFVGSVGTQSSEEAKENWMVMVVNPQASGFTAGQIINFTSINTISLDSSKKIATITAGSSDFVGTILAKVNITDAGDSTLTLKRKNLVTGNTTVAFTSGTDVGGVKVDLYNGQVYIPNSLVQPSGQLQSLYIADVKKIVKIIDSGSPSTSITDNMLVNPSYDVTRNYIFNNGQTDTYYGHSTITLRPGAPKAKGHLLVVLDYYDHTGGDGYFSVRSYLGAADGGVSTSPENYAEIGTYTSSAGTTYALRDCVDFRLSAKNAQATLEFRYSSSITSTGGVYLPVDLGSFISDYNAYLARNDLLILTKDNQFRLITGKSNFNPTYPATPDGALVLAKISLDPYTAYLPGENTTTLPNFSIEKVQHKRWAMSDISDLATRVSNIEYYTSLSLLEKEASSLQVPDANGLNRFKNGILVDNFTSFGTAKTGDADYNAKINNRLALMTAPENVLNLPLYNKNALKAFGSLSTSAQSGLYYKYHSTSGGASSIVTLPYTTANLAVQKLASNTVSLNPFAVALDEGVLDIFPPMDMWVSTTKQPDIVFVDPNLSIFREGQTLNTLAVSDWQTVAGTEKSTTTATRSKDKNGTTWIKETTVTTATQQQTITSGYFDKVSSFNGNFITDISIQPYIRPQDLVLRVSGMKINTPVNVYFDGENVEDHIVSTDIVELTSVNGTFNNGDIVGYLSAGTFVPTGRVISTVKTSNTTTRLYLMFTSSNKSLTSYAPNGILQNAVFDANGNYSTRTAFGTYSTTATSQIVLSGYVTGNTGGTTTLQTNGGSVTTGATTITLSDRSSSTNDFYNGSTVVVSSSVYNSTTNSLDRVVTKATITAYNGTTKVATLNTGVTVSGGLNFVGGGTSAVDINSTFTIKGTNNVVSRSIKQGLLPRLSTDEFGNFACVFRVPADTFKTGDRLVRIDNRTSDSDPSSATTYAEGTFTASSLATESVNLSFGATIQAAAKNRVFTSTNTRQAVISQRIVNKRDPLAQTFIIDRETYPNGVFLKSIKVFFQSKPIGDSAPPVNLFITDTLNGYPDGKVISGSLVTKTSKDINVSSTPHYLDATTYTEFTFESPVYIRPENLYAFILQTTTPDYRIWVASQNANAVASSVKNLPTDPTPSQISKIGGSPYVGTLFESQNGITWTADQTKSMMFVLDNCVFDVTATPTVEYVVPKKLPQRKTVLNDISYANNANTVADTTGIFYGNDYRSDAFNFSVTDFVPSGATVDYSFTPTLQSNYTSDTIKTVSPGKFGTTMTDHFYLDDGRGPRVLDANTDTSMVVYARMTTTDKYVSPVISDDGTSVYAIQYEINNMNLSNTDIVVTSGNTVGVTPIYATAPTVTISTPTAIGGTQAYAVANLVQVGVSSYIVDAIHVTEPGSGYITTPTITIAANTGGYSATAIINGETSAKGGNGIARYITKKVVLTPENESGDLRVYYTAYKPNGSQILVYYKLLNQNDTENFEDQNWQLMTEISPKAGVYSANRNDIREFVAAPGTGGQPDNQVKYTSTSGETYTLFNQFAIKIVLATNDSTKTPILYDMRVLATPSGL